MKYRELRIRWSITWGILCLLMIWYSVRCYQRSYVFGINLGGPTYYASSRYGYTLFQTIPNRNAVWPDGTQPTVPRVVFNSKRIRHGNDFYQPANPLGLDQLPRIIPHWIPLTFLGLLTAAPWLSWRFSRRYLCVLWSVGCGILCLLLVALWVRSNYLGDSIVVVRNVNRVTYFVSKTGVLHVGDMAKSNFNYPSGLHSFHLYAPVRALPLPERGFTYKVLADSWYISFPHWLLLLVGITLGALPWLPWRFSLRTLLIGMTVVAAILGTVAYALN